MPTGSCKVGHQNRTAHDRTSSKEKNNERCVCYLDSGRTCSSEDLQRKLKAITSWGVESLFLNIWIFPICLLREGDELS